MTKEHDQQLSKGDRIRRLRERLATSHELDRMRSVIAGILDLLADEL